MTDLALFDLPTTPAPTAPAPDERPRWVVEINEAHLNCYGAGAGGLWWSTYAGRPGIERRTTYLIIAPPGALLYVAMDDKEEADWFRGHMVEHGCSTKAVKVQRIGHLASCVDCQQRRPFWARSRRFGTRCRPCYDAWVQAGCPVIREPS